MPNRLRKRNIMQLLLLALLWGSLFLPVAAAQTKTHTNLLTAAQIADIRKTRTWDGVSVSNILATADQWMKYTPQQLRAMVPPAWVPRAYDANFKQDPLHSEAILKTGRYPFIVSPDLPYKITCPVGGEVYPTNNFDPTKPSSPSAVTSEPYIDNGWGWVKPGETQKYWFVGYYTHWLWSDYLQPGAKALGQAYIITGDQKYARQAIALLDKIAEQYPDMDYQKQSREGTEIYVNNYPGRILNNIWETGMVTTLAEAYDYAYEGMVGDTKLEQVAGKSIADIRRNIEINLLESAAQSIYTMDTRIRGNFGMHQKALATIAFVLDNERTAKYLDFVLNNTGGNTWLDEGVVSGLTNFIFRDGAPNESAPGYNAGWLGQLNNVARMLQTIGIDLYKQEPKLKRLFDYPLRLVMAGKFQPNIGDNGSVNSSGISGWNSTLYTDATKQYGDPNYLLGKPLTTKSDNMSAYGLAMLRGGKDSQPAGISIYYGPGGGHDHFARLNLEMFAKGYRILPDLGYPEYANAYSKKDQVWIRNTVSHNVVVVDGKRQTSKDGGKLQSFVAGQSVQYVDVRAEEAYPGIDRYQRSVALINTPGGEVYGIDVFRVAGGQTHDYSLHGPGGQFTASGISLTAEQGTVAGPDVPYGYLYDALNLEKPGYTGPYGGYTGSGFSYLNNVQRAQAKQVWNADWQLAGANTHIRTTFVPQPGTEVFVADGEPPRNVVGNPETVKYVLARTESSDKYPLGSTFVSVLQPYNDKPFITSVTPLGEKLPAGAVNAVALQVDHTEGRDYVFQAVNAAQTNAWGLSAAFQGSLAVVSRTIGGMVSHATLLGGGFVRQDDVLLQTSGSYTGQITAVDYATGKIQITLDANSPAIPIGNVLGQQRIVISNAQHATEYQIKQVTSLGGNRYELQFTDSAFQTGKGLVGGVYERSGSSTLSTPTPMVLNTYYNGQWMVNPNTGEGRRITSFSGSGSSITIAGSAMSLQKGGYFLVYDFGTGDRFQIVSTVDVQASTDGNYEVTSNVTGKLTLWDGVEHTLVPGRQTVKVPVLTIKVPQSALTEASQKISGKAAPEFTVEAPDGVKLSLVTVQVDGISVYNGNKAPVHGELMIDTTQLTDGTHPLTITAIDTLGKAVTRTLTLDVENWWGIVTELQAPVSSGWFGDVDFTHIYEKSAGWRFVADAPDSFAGDDDRMAASGGRDEYIVWETPALSEFRIAFYSRTPALPAMVELAVSGDNTNWRTVPMQVQAGRKSDAGWYRVDVEGKLRPSADVRFFRVIFHSSDVESSTQLTDIQVGKVSLRGQKL